MVKLNASSSFLFVSVAALVASLCCPPAACASDVTGTVSFQGQVVFPVPVAGISLSDMRVKPGTTAEATGNGTQCDVVSVTSDAADVAGTFPSGGAVTAQITISHGGPNPPEGDCLLTLRASGNDGATVSARGFLAVSVSLANIQNSETVAVGDIEARGSKRIAGLDKYCAKWVKKQLKLRSKCNWFLLKFGAEVGALKCRDAGEEPLNCDNGEYVPGILALAHGDTDQQLNPTAALGPIDSTVMLNQLNCQRFIGKAATNFTAVRSKRVQNLCIKTGVDSQSCRDARTKEAAPKLTVIDNCVGEPAADVLTGLVVPDLADPCKSTCVVGGVLDRRCLKSCFSLELSEASDGIIGDLPECGNGILQQGEGCDDGNFVNGDCCSDQCVPELTNGDQTCGVGACQVTVPVCVAGAPNTCTPLAPGIEGPVGDPTCSDGIDNDCDTLVDGADPDCN